MSDSMEADTRVNAEALRREGYILQARRALPAQRGGHKIRNVVERVGEDESAQKCPQKSPTRSKVFCSISKASQNVLTPGGLDVLLSAVKATF